MGERGREQSGRTQGHGRSWNLPLLHSGALKRVNGIDDVATTGSRKLEQGFHQKERDKTTAIELGAYIIDASKKVIGARGRHRRPHRQAVHGFRLSFPNPWTIVCRLRNQKTKPC